MIFLFIAPFVISDNMARDIGVTRLGTFIAVFFISWFMIFILMFVPKKPKKPTKVHKPFSNVTLTKTKD